MTSSRRCAQYLFYTAAAVVALMACQRSTSPQAVQPAQRQQTSLDGQTMGTTYTVRVVHRGAIDEMGLQTKVDERLHAVNASMSTYIADSELSKFNAASTIEPVAVSRQLAAVTQRALEIAHFSEGAFDVTVAPLIALWGFDAAGRRQTPPSQAEIDEVRSRVGADKVRAMLPDDGQAYLVKRAANVSVNLSGIAKGYGVDEVLRVVEKTVGDMLLGVMVEVGGEVRVVGENARGQAWRIGINVPRSSAQPDSVLRSVELRRRALATSGDYRNFFEANGKRFSHIIDPKTARPVEHDVVSVSVLAPDCATADALATALMVLGAEKGKAILSNFAEVDALFVRTASDDASALVLDSTAGFPQPR